jgi:hypothetical protein
MTRILCLLTLGFACCVSALGAPWSPAAAPLMTRWAAAVNPTNALPEYPRPQLVRSNWLNLNGLWQYALRPLDGPAPTAYDGEILVPFPIESSLSGVMTRLDAQTTLWYRRAVRIPLQWQGRRIRLQFGAVDWHCRVFVNGHQIGSHRGGYERFAFDITDALHWKGDEEIVVAADDPTEGDQPRGKQSRKPEGIFYTASSGIWQTVWLEPVPEVCIDELRMTPDVPTNALRLRVAVNTMADDVQVEASAFDGNTLESSVAGQANTELVLPLKDTKLWSPANPFLYRLEVVLKRGDHEIDHVESYFAMRTIGLVKDKGFTRLALNGDPLFQIGTLDQGFWPDGIYTAPTDAALRSDIEFLKTAGFNLIRKHVKIEPDRWYYWCDKLGMLVWQDMPNGNNASVEGQREFESELLHMVKDLYNHPSIVMWILFNEGWGQYDVPRLTQHLKTLDPTRLVDDASGWADARVGDVIDFHSYPGPNVPEPEPGRAAVLGEFGGLGLIVSGHTWSPTRRWSYRMEPDAQSLADSYLQLLRSAWNLHNLWGLSAAVYTQTSDVETECNGLLTYDRKVSKMDIGFLGQANRSIPPNSPTRAIVPDALSALPAWKYTFQKPPTNWIEPGFEATGWKAGTAGFGTLQTPGTVVTTIWDTDDIWLRRKFVLGQENLDGLKLEVHHDEDAEIYLNGILGAQLPKYIDHYELFDILPEALRALKQGTNTLAVHCHQTVGGQYIDVGLVIPDQKADRN